MRWLFEGFSGEQPVLRPLDPDDPERAPRAGFLARIGFLKSRVYAKLLKPPILKSYQTFNRQPYKPVLSEYNIGSLLIRQLA